MGNYQSQLHFTEFTGEEWKNTSEALHTKMSSGPTKHKQVHATSTAVTTIAEEAWDAKGSNLK